MKDSLPHLIAAIIITAPAVSIHKGGRMFYVEMCDERKKKKQRKRKYKTEKQSVIGSSFLLGDTCLIK